MNSQFEKCDNHFGSDQTNISKVVISIQNPLIALSKTGSSTEQNLPIFFTFLLFANICTRLAKLLSFYWTEIHILGNTSNSFFAEKNIILLVNSNQKSLKCLLDG